MFRYNELDDGQLNNYFKLPKSVIANLIWRDLPHSACAVVVVIGVHANEQGVAFPSEETIACLSGLTRKTVRYAVRCLEQVWPGFTTEHYVTRYGCRGKRYRFENQPKAGKDYIAFYRRFIDGGNWFELNNRCQHTQVSRPAACSVYPVLRYYAKPACFDEVMDAVHGEEADGEIDLRESYPDRPWDYHIAENSVVCQSAGVARNSLAPAMRELERTGFMDSDEYGAARIYRRPQIFFNRDHLNSEIGRRKLDVNTYP